PAPDARWLAVAATLRVHRGAAVHGPLARWSSGGRRETPLRLEAAGGEHVLHVEYGAGGPTRATLADGTRVEVAVHADDGLRAEVSVDGLRGAAAATFRGDRGWLDAFGLSDGVVDATDRPRRSDGGEAGGTIVCRMHGQLTRLGVEPGQRVERGAWLLSIEAMKMEHRFEAPVSGTVVEVGASPGTQVAPGRLLVRIEPDPA
ncbi:MAG: acetyl-CoA carboxylase biotin carboxyl carrier protein subunit, partial [Burkholderiales bacterium]